MNTTPTVLSGSDLEAPSGAEVESARFHEPIEKRGALAKLERIRLRGGRTVHDLRYRLADRAKIAQSAMHHSMQANPEKWVAIAAGAGFGLGLLGRFVHWRKRRNRMPDLIVIDAQLLKM